MAANNTAAIMEQSQDHSYDIGLYLKLHIMAVKGAAFKCRATKWWRGLKSPKTRQWVTRSRRSVQVVLVCDIISQRRKTYMTRKHWSERFYHRSYIYCWTLNCELSVKWTLSLVLGSLDVFIRSHFWIFIWCFVNICGPETWILISLTKVAFSSCSVTAGPQ